MLQLVVDKVPACSVSTEEEKCMTGGPALFLSPIVECYSCQTKLFDTACPEIMIQVVNLVMKSEFT